MRDEMGMPIPVRIASKRLKFDLAPELLQRGEWVCLNIDPFCPWPVRPQSLLFSNYQIWIIPLTLEEHPGVAIKCAPGMNQESAESLLYRFLSVIAWQHSCGIAVIHRTGGTLPTMIELTKNYGFAIRDTFDFTEIICPEEEGPRIALALMREARSLNHHGYTFLSFWRVLELAYPKSKERVAWMTATLKTLSGSGVKEALESIADQGIEDIGSHLFKSGRCAVAHATGEPVINPDDPRDASRLYRELPIVREMAVRAIESRFGILSSSSEYRQHLYELRGWKELLGADLIKRLLSGEGACQDQTVELPNIHVRLRENLPYGPFEGMNAHNLEAQGNKLRIAYRSPDQIVEFHFVLDLGAERLTFDLTQGLFGHDDGSVKSAKHRKDIQRFIRDYLLNGELQIWNAETGKLLSRKDAFLPNNYFVDLDICNKLISDAQAEIDRRRAVRS